MVMQVLKLPLGLEPRTSTLPRWRSTTELWQPDDAVFLTPRSYRLYDELARREWRAGAPGVRKGGEYMTRLVKVNCTTRVNVRCRVEQGGCLCPRSFLGPPPHRVNLPRS